MRVTIAAPAKINLWLRVGPTEEDGFHSLSTLFCGLRLADSIVVRPGSPDAASGGGEVGLETSFAPPLERLPDLGPPESNLATRAARAFADRAGLEGGPRIRIVKRIPAGGGLGGGSSDAGAVLRGLRRLHPDSLAGPDLLDVGAELGSDVPFFVLGVPLALGRGRGERVEAVSTLPVRPVVLVLPPFGVSTGDAYGWLDEARAESGWSGAPDELEAGAAPSTWEGVAERAINDFEDVVFPRHPLLRELRDDLRDRGASPALMAGSGSTVFGVFETEAAAETAAEALRGKHTDCRVVVTATRLR